MGSGIAQVAAQAGHQVFLVDAVPGAADQARDRLAATLAKLADRGKLDPTQAQQATDRLSVVAGPTDLPPCGLVIEAIREDLADKQALFAALADTQAADTVLASNTSSLDIAAIAETVPHPGRVIGLHFFNPPALMKLVEVIRGANSQESVLEEMTALMRDWGKTPVRCVSAPGFIVNRVARPFYGEAQRMVADGTVDPATLDYCLRERAGFRMGPLELGDLIGHDVNYAVGASVWEQTGKDPRYTPTEYQRALVEAGRLGRKSGRGVYRYDQDGQAVDAAPDVELADRLVGGPITTDPVARTLAMLVNEAADLVGRGEATAQDVDVAMKLGTNYPKGPIEWGREIGLDRVAGQLRELDEAFPGGRYRPSPALTDGTLE